jgi:hypothetical protein
MPLSRWEDYTSLISRIRPGVESVTIDYDGAIGFVFAADGGHFRPQWNKGIRYVPPGGVIGVDDRLIEPGWYIFYERFD